MDLSHFHLLHFIKLLLQMCVLDGKAIEGILVRVIPWCAMKAKDCLFGYWFRSTTHSSFPCAGCFPSGSWYLGYLFYPFLEAFCPTPEFEIGWRMTSDQELACLFSWHGKYAFKIQEQAWFCKGKCRLTHFLHWKGNNISSALYPLFLCTCYWQGNM